MICTAIDAESSRAFIADSSEGGTIFDAICKRIADLRWYEPWISNMLSREQIAKLACKDSQILSSLGLNQNQQRLLSRMPRNIPNFMQECLNALVQSRILRKDTFGLREFEIAYAGSKEQLNHGKFSTYIFPEEAALATEISRQVQPKNVAALGCYYGYWTYFAATHVQDEGVIHLFDTNQEVLNLALRNITISRPDLTVICHLGDAISLLDSHREVLELDLVLLDAEGPDDHPLFEYRGKAIYAPLLQAVYPHMEEGAVLAAHNILLSHWDEEDKYMQNLTAENREELRRFLTLTQRLFPINCILESTEGTGLYKK